MDLNHCRGSMGPVHTSGPWTRSKMGEGGGGGPCFGPILYGMQHLRCPATLSNKDYAAQKIVCFLDKSLLMFSAYHIGL